MSLQKPGLFGKGPLVQHPTERPSAQRIRPGEVKQGATLQWFHTNACH